MSIDPLPIDAALVDAQGRPTPLFIRRWDDLRRALEALSGVTGEYDTGTHTLHITLENGRIVDVTAT